MVQSGNKGFDLKSNLNKMLLFTMLRMINHLRPRNRRSSQHDLPNLDWQLFAVPLSRATLDDPNFLIRLLTLTMASPPPSEKQILGSIATSLGVISRKRTLSLTRLLPPQGFDPDGQNPRRHPRGPRVLGRKISQYQKKSRFFKGSQGIKIAETHIAHSYRKFIC